MPPGSCSGLGPQGTGGEGPAVACAWGSADLLPGPPQIGESAPAEVGPASKECSSPSSLTHPDWFCHGAQSERLWSQEDQWGCGSQAPGDRVTLRETRD